MEWQAVLEKLVDGLRDPDCLWFEGPFTAHALGAQYITISSNGKKKPGADDPLEDSAPTAIAKFILELAAVLGGATQVAWRRHPAIETFVGGFRVSCRVVPYPEPKEGQ